MARSNIARLNSDGTLDMNFDPNANLPVGSIAVQANGQILAGGVFTHIGGQDRSFIARLNAVTGMVDTFDPFNPAADDVVRSIAVEANGDILAGGFFTHIGGQPRSHIARLFAANGMAALSFDPNANVGGVYPIAVQANGKILVGGDFTTLSPNGGMPVMRNHIARLFAMNGVPDSFDPNANNNNVLSIAVQANGDILAGGPFTHIGGQNRNFIARLDAATGSADPLFDLNANDVVRSIAVQADGKILPVGDFTSIGGADRYYIARLDATGAADLFAPDADYFVYAIAVQADGKILAGGFFQQHRRTIAPPFRSFEQRHPRAAKPRRDAKHHYLDTRRLNPAIHARYL